MEAARIVEAVFVPCRDRYGNVTVMALMSNGEIVDVLSFYDDELQFSLWEFEGMTQDEVSRLFTKRDVAYLQS